jgi:hypothetical protein
LIYRGRHWTKSRRKSTRWSTGKLASAKIKGTFATAPLGQEIRGKYVLPKQLQAVFVKEVGNG